MGSGGSSSPSPDPNIGIAALKQAQTGEEFLAYMKDQAAVTNAWAAEDRARYKSVYQPIENDFLDRVKTWDSPERQAVAASEAAADVRGNAAITDAARTRQMASMGINPTSGRYAGIERAGDLATSLAAAGAQNAARTQVRTQGLGLQGDAINMGKGMPSQALAAMQTLNGAAGAGFQGAQSGYAGQANALNQQYSTQSANWRQEQSSGGGILGAVGRIAPLAMTMMSDEDVKENKVEAKGSLKAIENMRVDDWDYKEGVADGKRHRGTYAQDFKRETGFGDGRTINFIDAVGVTMGAIKELSAKVDKLAAKPKSRGIGTATRRAA